MLIEQVNYMMYFIDFDDTIFNTGKFVKNYKKVFFEHGISDEEFEESYIPCSDETTKKAFKVYDLEKQLLDIESRHGDISNLKKDLNTFIESAKNYVFDDFYQFIEKIPKKNVFLVSFGKSPFQETKIENSGVLEYVHDYVLTNTSKADCINEIFSRNKQGERKLTFVDDRPDQLNIVKKEFPEMLIYRIMRSEGRYGDIATPKGIPKINKLIDIL
ncbi:MAG: HAD hydrolase-like protein [Patescibacteria group bacterium]|jgi:hypothetical protein|nr:HAD hydrolase-like protein [Patescibacteria group bacterium]